MGTASKTVRREELGLPTVTIMGDHLRFVRRDQVSSQNLYLCFLVPHHSIRSVLMPNTSRARADVSPCSKFLSSTVHREGL